MIALLDRVRQFIRDHDLAGRETRVVVGVSGGSDSVALACIVRELDAAGELRAAGLAHFNHQLRPAAVDDERFCERLAESFSWPIRIEREDVAARARRERHSLEHAAHLARHEFFARARGHFGADVVALAHTRDDQAETFLLRLLRGAGPRGLAAMHPRHGAIVRPLLSCRRSELRAYLAERRVGYVEDESNADQTIPRNRIRGELLPLLADRFNPQIVEILANEAELARDTWHWLEKEADRLDALRHSVSEGVQELDVQILSAAPLALRRFAVWRAMSVAARGRPVSFDHVQAVLRLVECGARGSIDMPGHRVERLGPKLVLTGRPQGVAGRWTAANLFDYPLSIPGEVPLPLAGCALSAETLPAGVVDARAMSSNPAVAVVRRDLCGSLLRVRNRRPGDRFRPVGLEGNKKLQDFFVDRKVARHRRDAVPLVVDEAGRIVWVAGYGIDEGFRVTDAAQAVVVLRLKLLGGGA